MCKKVVNRLKWIVALRPTLYFICLYVLSRAKALKVYSSSVEVYFIDYGNCEEVPSDDVKELPDRFRKLPAQATHCGLHGISGKICSLKFMLSLLRIKEKLTILAECY